MAYKTLTKEEVEQFVEYGWVRVEEAYSRSDALAAQNFLWDRLEEREITRDSSTWPMERYTIQESYSSPEFQACNTPRLLNAIEDLVGEGRCKAERDAEVRWGWWQINFGFGIDEPWDVPTKGWHFDGIHFRHYVNSPDQGLLLLCLFSDVRPQGGGTLAIEGSHHIVGRMLQEQPNGIELKEAIQLTYQHPYMAELTGKSELRSADGNAAKRKLTTDSEQDGGQSSSVTERIQRFMNETYTDPEGYTLRVIETTGNAGDAILCHPFLIHAVSQNHNKVPRFMCNRTTPLKQPMNVNREDPADYSPLEFSIQRTLR